MAILRMFASAREAAGTGCAEFEGATVAAVLEGAVATFGSRFALILPICKIWVNGDAAESTTRVGRDDEVAVLPPVSGGT